MKKNILFKLTGSIACYKACPVISRLVQNDFEVKTACSPQALQFIGPATLSGLTGHPVFSDVFDHSRMMDHITLTKWAHLTILCPATAHSLNQLASGLAQDVIGTLFLAHDFSKPYVIAPAMNQEMYKHPSVQASIDKLKSWKVHVLPTDYGVQACGDVGYGRLLEPDQIFKTIKELCP